MYCASVWGFSHKTHLNKITVAQKKIIRIIGGYNNILYLSLSQGQNILDKVLIISGLCSGMVSQLVLGLLMTL